MEKPPDPKKRSRIKMLKINFLPFIYTGYELVEAALVECALSVLTKVHHSAISWCRPYADTTREKLVFHPPQISFVSDKKKKKKIAGFLSFIEDKTFLNRGLITVNSSEKKIASMF